MLSKFEVSSINHVRRTSNEVAHRLAKDGCGNEVSNSWLGHPPAYVMNRLVLDTEA
jgi:hypothetical protein